jgi:phosphoribosylanthranilate isomerase
VKIKICGLCREEDVDFANEAAPDYVGFVFALGRRQVSIERAKKLRERLSDTIIPVGVFEHAPIEMITQLYSSGTIELIQLHGNESAEYCILLRTLGLPVVKTIQADKLDKHIATFPAACFLIDNGAGSGKPFDWAILKGHEDTVQKRCFIAGGINIDNVVDVMTYNPYGIDVSSGVETNGFKDKEKMIQLVKAVRAGV